MLFRSEYDPMLAKLSAWGDTRSAAIQRLRRAVQEYRILGITTNLRLFEALMRDECFNAGLLHTGFLDEFMLRRDTGSNGDSAPLVAAMLAAAQEGVDTTPVLAGPSLNNGSLWRSAGRRGAR